ncbi:sensor histidine kinase GacS-like [Ylistrum balloti]|uniref:sensor histidine kinase GacS-like n=1 Tax=Ylistrum balloti TaxID=509963 RepID=UPI0029059671|nr:sensor histidine kinase GacS-like [Ylistrum balloti]
MWRSRVTEAPEMIIEISLDFEVLYINQTDLLFLPAEVLLGRNILDFIPEPFQDKVLKVAEIITTTLKPQSVEIEIISPKTGEIRTFSARARPILQDGEVVSLTGVATDITERKQTEEALQRAKYEADQANRLKTEFLANMSHEIRTPLNVILGYTSLVEQYTQQYLSKERIAYFEHIRHASRRLLDTIQKIIDISRFHIEDFPFEKQPICLNQALSECVDELQVLADQKNLTLEYEKLEQDLWVQFDPYALPQVLTNVIENAIKYTDSGFISIKLAATSNQVNLNVTDTGIGISDTYLPHIFDEFSQEEVGYGRAYEGTGLGMALVKKFIDLGNGELRIRSEKGTGTTVTINLPRYIPDAIVEQTVQPVIPQDQEEEKIVDRPTILVVEDDLSTQEFMQTVLQDQCNVLIADSRSEVEAVLARECPELIFLDLSLREGEDGAELVRRLRQQDDLRTLPIIALSAHAMDIDRERALAAGCDDYLVKPCSLDKLLSMIRQYT